MPRLALVLLTTLQLAGMVAAGGQFLGEHGRCFSGCMTPLNFIEFSDTPEDPNIWAGRLTSQYWINSVVACMSSYGSEVEVQEGWVRLHNYAGQFAPGTPVPEYAEVLERVEGLEYVPVVDATAGGMMNSTVLVERDNYLNGLRTNDVFSDQLYYHSAFGFSMYALLAVMTFVGIANRVLAIAMTSKSRNRWFIRGRTWVARHISTPALMGYRHVQPWAFMSIPTRLEGIMIGVYLFLNLLFTFICYEVFEENMFFYHRIDLQYARYFADRTDIMSMYNMVLLWLLAGRNDVVIWLTGWSYQSMNLFHRWTARVAVFQAIAHSIAYSYIKWGELWDMMAEDSYWGFWATGVYATIVMSLILPLSLRTIRTKLYEFFLAIHIIFSIFFLVVLWYHVIRFGFAPMVWICVGLWLFDRVLRILRVIYLSYHTIKTQNATVEITANDPALLRLTVTSSVNISPSPGDYYFLYSKWWPENHPFTLASWNPSPTGKGTELHFLIAPLAGWTRRLRRHDGGTTTVLLEGPYGHSRDLGEYDHVLLLAGGSGIASLLPYISTLRNDKVKVTVIWTVRNAEYAADVLGRELGEEVTDHIELQVYLTQQIPDTARNLLALHKPGEEEVDRRRLELFPGRPDLREVLDESIARLGDGERLAVLACGPAGMMDDTRREVARSYGTWLGCLEADRLEYFEESFTW